jgi:hypothetical protein
MKLGLTERVTTSPQSLLGLLDVVGLTTVSPGELSALYINPLLANAVSEIWPDAEALARAGVELSGQSLPRLRRVFDQKLHAMLTRAAESDAPVSPEDDELHGEAEAQNYIAILDAAKDRGLRLIPPAQTLKDTIDRGRMEAHESIAQVAQFKQALDKMEELIGQFGARRQRYLRRMLRIAKEKKDT